LSNGLGSGPHPRGDRRHAPAGPAGRPRPAASPVRAPTPAATRAPAAPCASPVARARRASGSSPRSPPPRAPRATRRCPRGRRRRVPPPDVQDRPALFSTFLMWLLADLFGDLPEVGDAEKPKLVFFFDEAHLLFNGASKEFLAQVVQTVRLIRSKGVGIFFVTQTPKDVPADVLAQLGNRVQHALRAFTPDDAKALRATARTFPTSDYDLEEVLTSMGTGEAVVTVLTEKGAPTPVAWTRLRAPQAS